METRVGLLLLTAVLLMGSFLVVLGGITFKSGYNVSVDFNNPGALKPGASVRIAGVHVGMVESIQYLGGKLDPQTGRTPLVRAELKLNQDIQESVRKDARFFVTSAGILGEPFLALEPGSQTAPVLEAGSISVGIDPPRLDQALAMGYELLDTMVTGVRNNREEIGELMHGAGGMLKNLNAAIGENGNKFEDLVAKVETMSADGTTMIKEIREDYVEGPKVKRIVNTVDQAMQKASPMVADVHATVKDVFGAEQRVQLKTTIGDVASLADRSKGNLDSANKALNEMNRGEGMVGALLKDQDMYDDFQEVLRDLKHNPWKLFWRE
jgi:phospholipid/cholesterol/gamma-HCH transport system substrate-binding protein